METFVKKNVDEYADMLAMAVILICQKQTQGGSYHVSVDEAMDMLYLTADDRELIRSNHFEICDMAAVKAAFYDNIVAECEYHAGDKEFDITMFTDMCGIDKDL